MGRPQDLKSGNMEERRKQFIHHLLTDQRDSTQRTAEAEKTREHSRTMRPLMYGPETVCALSSRPATEPRAVLLQCVCV